MLVDEKPCGGSAVQTYGWIKGLLDEGQEVYVMTDVYNKKVLKDECRDIKFIPMYDNKRGIRWLRWIYYRVPYTYKKIKAIKPDYLYSSIPAWSSVLIAIMCYFLNIKFIQRISSDANLDSRFLKKNSAINQFFLFLGLRLSHHILCQNNYQLKTIKKKFPRKSAIKLLNPFYSNNQDWVYEEHSRNYIAWVGLYRQAKNIKLLYQVASLLKKEQFLIAGQAGANYDAESREYVEKLKLLPNVKFSGYIGRTQILPFLSKAKFLLNTSHFEGFSNTFLEAWSVGTPILSTINVNPDSIISNHTLGLVYNDVFDLCKQHAAVTPELYRLMSDNSRQYVSNYHGYRLVARQLLRYLSITDKTITSNTYMNAPA